MKRSRGIIFAVITALFLVGGCFAVVYFAFPEVFGKDEPKTPEALTGMPIEETQETAESLALAQTGETKEAVVTSEPAGEPLVPESSEVPKESQAPESSEAPKESQAPESSEVPKESQAPESSKAPKESQAPESSEAPKESQAPESSEAPKETQAPESSETLKDRYAPVFLSFTASPQIKVGSAFDVHKYIGYADDVDRNVDMKVTGEVDTSKEGTYSIKITLTDDAGRTTTKGMDVKVVTTLSSGSSGNTKKEEFSDFVKNYKTEETSLGIDVSRWQEDIDFEKAKAAGCEFVYMRLGGYDNGEHYTDRYYEKNITGAKANGMKIGIYWHAEESSPEEIEASVKYLVGVLNGEKLDFPIAYDWEDYKNFETYGMNLYDLNACFDNFEKEVEKYGYSACLYGSKNAQENIWTNKKKNPIWLAHYTSATSYGGEYFMWQHSCTGRIDGIKGDVDLDVFYPARLKIQ